MDGFLAHPDGALEHLPSGRRGVVGGAWSGAGPLLAFARVAHDAQPAARPAEMAGWAASSPHVELSGARSAALRRLAHAGLPVFSALAAQKPQDGAGRPPTPALLAASRALRGHVQTAIDALDAEGSEALADLMACALAVWHVAEIFALDDARPTATAALVEWVREHYASDARQRDEEAWTLEVQRAQPPESAPHFWDLACQLLCGGRTDDAWAVLKQHSGARAELAGAFRQLEQLLQSMPRMDDAHPQARAEWRRWRRGVQAVLDSEPAAADPVRGESLRRVLRVLLGDEDTLLGLCEEWFELLVAELLFRHPLLRKHEVGAVAAACVQRTGVQLNPYNQICLAVLEGDVARAVRGYHELGIAWVSAHLTDLLASAGALAEFDARGDLREHFLVEFAAELGPDDWQLALAYLRHCPRRGQAHAAELVGRVRPATERDARKLVAACLRAGLPDEAQAVRSARALHWARRQRPAAAMAWVVASPGQQLAAVGERVVDGVVEGGDLAQLNAVASLLDPAASFLPAYRDLRLVLEDRAVVAAAGNAPDNVAFLNREAAARLCRLLGPSSGCPQRFWARLLVLAEPLLAADPVPFAVSETALLLRALQTLEMSHKHDEYLRAVHSKQREGLRLALVRAHARAIVVASSSSV